MNATLHPESPGIGLPYAPAGVDEHGYYVECPCCGERFRGCDESQETTEDALTKGAAQQYAEHYHSATTLEREA